MTRGGSTASSRGSAMSTAVANQMTASMNASLTQTRIPGADNAMNQVDGRDIYFVAMNDISSGPYSAIELARLIADGKVVKETYVWKPGMTKWDLVENMVARRMAAGRSDAGVTDLTVYDGFLREVDAS